MCKSSSTTSNASPVVVKQSWADIEDDDDTWATPDAREVSKSSSSMSTPSTASPKQSWADMSEDDISEGELLTVPQTKTGQSSRVAQATARVSSNGNGKIISERCMRDEAFTAARGVLVEVAGMPKKLCSKMFLETIFEQIGVDGNVCGHQIRSENDDLVVAIKFNCEDAANRCCKHFETSSWSTGALKAVVRESTLPAPPSRGANSSTNVDNTVPQQAPVVVWNTWQSNQQYSQDIAWESHCSQWGSQWPQSWFLGQDVNSPWVHPLLTGPVHANPMPYAAADKSVHEVALARAKAYARVC